MDKITIYTDGSCLGNPGPGGWGVVLLYKHHKKRVSGSKKLSTNNEMELMAAIKALEGINNKNIEIDLHTDSSYVKDGITSWIFNWKKNGWKTSKKKEVKNCQLWMKLDELANELKVNWHWVKAHNGNRYNEEVDLLARNAAEKLRV